MTSTPPPLPRSPELMSRCDTALLVIDVQEKLMPLVLGRAQIAWNVGRLIDGAKLLGVPVLASEQYPKGLGPTIEPLRGRLSPPAEKLTFSCGGCPELFAELGGRGIHKILAVGVECHVCVQQSVLDLMAEGFRVFVAVDAVGSRHALDCEVALRRMESAGAVLTTTEAALFEWCAEAGTPEFKAISALVRQPPPVAGVSA